LVRACGEESLGSAEVPKQLVAAGWSNPTAGGHFAPCLRSSVRSRAISAASSAVDVLLPTPPFWCATAIDTSRVGGGPAAEAWRSERGRSIVAGISPPAAGAAHAVVPAGGLENG
jgi:hypothetical protein